MRPASRRNPCESPPAASFPARRRSRHAAEAGPTSPCQPGSCRWYRTESPQSLDRSDSCLRPYADGSTSNPRWSAHLTSPALRSSSTACAVLTRLREKHTAILSEQCVDAMTGAIDRACHLVKSQPKKAFFSDWFAIFGNFDTFYSLWEEA